MVVKGTRRAHITHIQRCYATRFLQTMLKRVFGAELFNGSILLALWGKYAKRAYGLACNQSVTSSSQNTPMYPHIRYTVYSRSPKVGNPIASILKSNVKGIPALFGLNPVSNFMGFTVYGFD